MEDTIKTTPKYVQDFLKLNPSYTFMKGKLRRLENGEIVPHPCEKANKRYTPTILKKCGAGYTEWMLAELDKHNDDNTVKVRKEWEEKTRAKVEESVQRMVNNINES